MRLKPHGWLGEGECSTWNVGFLWGAGRTEGGVAMALILEFLFLLVTQLFGELALMAFGVLWRWLASFYN
jgi:hypothetical protein